MVGCLFMHVYILEPVYSVCTCAIASFQGLYTILAFVVEDLRWQKSGHEDHMYIHKHAYTH